MIGLLIWLLILAIVVVVICYVIDLLSLPPPIPVLVKLVVGLIALWLILQQVLPMLGSGGHLSLH